MTKVLKRVDKSLRRRLNSLLMRLQPKQKSPLPLLKDVRKVLLFRLDQRIGNGILLIPLLRAIRDSSGTIELHFLIHRPVAGLLETLVDFPIDRIWAYDQPALMRRPWRYLLLLRRLRNEGFDLVITANNPNGFSLSHAIFGRLCQPGCFVGFDAKDGARYFDAPVQSSPQIHYANAMVDLWRVMDPKSKCRFGGLAIQPALRNRIGGTLAGLPEYPILFWLGATRNKVLSGEIIAYLYAQVRQQCDRPIIFAIGPADAQRLAGFPNWLQEQTLVWQKPLVETAAFIASCAAFVSGDTGPMHLAVALKVPTLTIFLNSNIQQYGYCVSGQHYSHIWTDMPDPKIGINQSIEQLCETLSNE